MERNRFSYEIVEFGDKTRRLTSPAARSFPSGEIATAETGDLFPSNTPSSLSSLPVHEYRWILVSWDWGEIGEIRYMRR